LLPSRRLTAHCKRSSRRRILPVCLSVLATVLAGRIALSLDNGLARTPPMGWNSWNAFETNVDEKLIKETADAIVTTGMKDAGYTYVGVDAGWKAKRRAMDGNLMADPARFPSGMKSLADYIHEKGLKFGLYTDAGTEDCVSGAPGSRGFEEKDAAQFAVWGVDFIKEDWCHSEGLNAKQAYTKMSKAILATGRPMIFSLCEWGDNQPWLWAPDVGHMWRTTGDNKDCWDCGRDTASKPGGYPRGWTLILDAQPALHSYSGPGHWNDPDMLEVGNGGMTTSESKAHFSLWALLAAPLIAGNDVRTMSAHTKEILLNREVIAIDQDPLGQQGRQIWKKDNLEVWSRPVSDGSRAVVLFNRSKNVAQIAVTWEQIGYPGHLKAKVRDLWQHKDVGYFSNSYSAKVDSHGVVMVKVTP